MFASTDATVVDVLLRVHARSPEAVPYRFLDDELRETAHCSYRDVVLRACAVGASLRARGVREGDRVLLLFPTCPEFVFALYGCFLARFVAVPVFPPVKSLAGDLQRIRRVAHDCDARAVLTLGSLARVVGAVGYVPGMSAPALRTVVAVDQLPSAVREDADSTRPLGSDVAMLQYSSGSTGDPKGVVISHASLLHHLRSVIFPVLVSASGIDDSVTESALSWLAPWHDMGCFGTTCVRRFSTTHCLLTRCSFSFAQRL